MLCPAQVHAPAPLLGSDDGPTVLQTMQTKLAIKQKVQAENKKLVKELGAKDHYRQAQERAAEAERKKKDAAFWNKASHMQACTGFLCRWSYGLDIS